MNTGISKEDLLEIIKASSGANAQVLAEAIERAILTTKAVAPEEQLAIDDKKARIAKSKQEWRNMINYENEQKRRLVEGCTHRKDNGRFAISGQIIGGKQVLLMCLRCQGVWKLDVTQEQKSLIEHGDIELLGSAPPPGVLASVA